MSSANEIMGHPLQHIQSWENLSQDHNVIGQLEKSILPQYLKTCRWFAGKARKMTTVCIDSMLSLTDAHKTFHLLLIKIKYRTGKQEQYLLPVSLVPAEQYDHMPSRAIISSSTNGEKEMVLIDAIYDESFRRLLFHHLFHSAKVRQSNGALFFTRGKAFKTEDFREDIPSRVLDADQSNSSLIYDEKYFLKIYRKLFRETNPDVEVVRFLTEQAGFTHIPAFAGTLGWKKPYSPPITFGMMQEKVESIKDAWSLVGDYLNEYLNGIVSGSFSVNQFTLDQAGLLGQRTAEMHIALGSDSGDSAFAPEPFNDEYRDWLFAHFESLLKRRVQLARENLSVLDEKGKLLANHFLDYTDAIRNFFLQIKNRDIRSLRTRIHGDYHLGQVLFNGTDYIILDFEGEPESSIADRKIRHSPLKDVAGMLRSFHYAVSAKLYFSSETRDMSDEVIEQAAQYWYKAVTETYLGKYFETFGQHPVLATDANEKAFLLQIHLLEKAIYELGYEFNGRPTWVKIPLKGIEQVMKEMMTV